MAQLGYYEIQFSTTQSPDLVEQSQQALIKALPTRYQNIGLLLTVNLDHL